MTGSIPTKSPSAPMIEYNIWNNSRFATPLSISSIDRSCCSKPKLEAKSFRLVGFRIWILLFSISFDDMAYKSLEVTVYSINKNSRRASPISSRRLISTETS